jgi:hypothetical protein
MQTLEREDRKLKARALDTLRKFSAPARGEDPSPRPQPRP